MEHSIMPLLELFVKTDKNVLGWKTNINLKKKKFYYKGLEYVNNIVL